MTGHDNGYGLWPLVFLNTGVFVFFVLSFAPPKTKRDWRSFGAFSGFLLALFTEMYGFPLTIYFLSGWLGNRFPELTKLTHENGHIWQTLLGFKGDPHSNPIHIVSTFFIAGGGILLASSWRILFEAQKAGRVASEGPYARLRHPQYLAFLLIMFGFLIQWPTLPTLIMFPIMAVMYARLARKEEAESKAMFGEAWEKYANRTPAFFPRLIIQGNRP